MTYFFIFFFNDTATTEIYTLSLHDALPIYFCLIEQDIGGHENGILQQSVTDSLLRFGLSLVLRHPIQPADRKSTRLNSSHANISYAVFCLKKKIKLQHKRFLLLVRWLILNM